MRAVALDEELCELDDEKWGTPRAKLTGTFAEIRTLIERQVKLAAARGT